jgi:hypothetical protein
MGTDAALAAGLTWWSTPLVPSLPVRRASAGADETGVRLDFVADHSMRSTAGSPEFGGGARK